MFFILPNTNGSRARSDRMTLNQLLVEMDGFENNNGCLVLVAEPGVARSPRVPLNVDFSAGLICQGSWSSARRIFQNRSTRHKRRNAWTELLCASQILELCAEVLECCIEPWRP